MKKFGLLALSLCMMILVFSTSVFAAAIYDHEVTFDLNGGKYYHHDVTEFAEDLVDGSKPIIVSVIGDSTSVGSSSWAYAAFSQIGGVADNYSIKFRSWDTVSSSYKTNTNIQYGTDGDAYVDLNGVAGTYVSALDTTDFSITGDIDIRAKIRFTGDITSNIVSKWRGTGNLSYNLSFTPSVGGASSYLELAWSADGSTAILKSSALSTAIAKDTDVWVRVTLDVDNGAGGNDVMFYTSLDGITYTQIGSTVTTATATSIYSSNSPLEIGSRTLGTLGNFEGRIYEVEIRNGINGAIVASPDFGMAFPSTVSSFNDVEGNIWNLYGDYTVGNGSPCLYVMNGSISATTTESFSASLLNSLLEINPDLIFINFGHNEGLNDSYATEIEEFSKNVLTYSPNSALVLMTQNPQVSPRTAAEIAAQDVRNDQVRLVAARNDFALVDAAKVLSLDTATFISADGYHPTAAGYVVWGDTVSDMFTNAINLTGPSSFAMLVEDGELIVQPDNPIKTGATFIGWYTNEALTDEWDYDTDLVQDEMTLYAKYSDSTTGVAVISITPTSLDIFGVAWYFWAMGVAAVIYFGFTKKGRKSIGLK